MRARRDQCADRSTSGCAQRDPCAWACKCMISLSSFFFSAHCCASVRAQWAPPMQRSMQSFFLFLTLLRVLLTPMRYYTHGRPKWAPLACSSAQFLFLIMWGMIDFYFFLILWVLAMIEHCFYTSLTIRTSH